jgi:sarcosine oxidase subunit delta
MGNPSPSTHTASVHTVRAMWVTCPNCGRRDVSEFAYGGEDRGEPTSDPRAEFVRVFLRANTAGRVTERWHHDGGCSAWFTIVRDTTTHEIDADVPV